MKRTLLLSTIIFFLFFIPAFPQEHEKPSFKRNQIGIQFNPYINDGFIAFRRMQMVSSLRYGYRITKNITTGMEFSCYFPIYINMNQKIRWYSYNVGVITRFLILPDRRFQVFAEASPYYSHSYSEGLNSEVYIFNKLGTYVAPGVSLYSKNKKFSLDLYYKFSNLTFNGTKSVLSYKVNYNF